MQEYIKKILRSGNITLIISNDEINDIVKTIKSLEDSGLLLKGVTEAVQNKVTNIFRIQAYDSIMCGYFCIGFIDFMLAGKNLTEYTNLFSPNNFNKDDDIILNYFMDNI